MTYEEALSFVASLEIRGWRLGLDRMEEFVRRCGLTSTLNGRGYLHVAGTNGKGSVTAYCQSILRASGYRVGGYFSPFVYNIRERIQFDGKPISEEGFVALVSRLKPAAHRFDIDPLGAITEFEFKTAMGLAYWQDREAEWVALEVGLGGRLDATNVVDPAVCAIVSIGLDHMAILGESLAAIAGEKAGILKAGRPGVIGALPKEAADAVRKRGLEAGAPLWEFGREFGIDESGRIFTPKRRIDVRPPIPGQHQHHNVAVAIAAIDASGAEATDAAIVRGLAETKLPGRFERRPMGGALVVLDGAHNLESMEALAETLRIEYPGQKWAAVFGMLDGHDPKPVAALMDSLAAEVHLAPIDFRRTREPRDLAPYFSIATTQSPNAVEAFRKAMASGLPVLVTGSFYLVGEVGRAMDL
jgi:dihydrofolate synthase / folylpolyglutamate synthase